MLIGVCTLFGEASLIHPALLVGPLAVSLIFLFSSFAKARRPMNAVGAVSRFGWPSWLGRRVFIYLLAAAELLIAAALLAMPSPLFRVASWAATGLLLVFSVSVWIALRNGESFDCGCFGDENSPITWRMLGRNLLLTTFVFAAGWGAMGDVGVLMQVADLPRDQQVWIAVASILVLRLADSIRRNSFRHESLGDLAGEQPTDSGPSMEQIDNVVALLDKTPAEWQDQMAAYVHK